jgi:hypothetical protein
MAQKLKTGIISNMDGVQLTHQMTSTLDCYCIQCEKVITNGFMLPDFSMDKEAMAKHDGHTLFYRDSTNNVTFVKVSSKSARITGEELYDAIRDAHLEKPSASWGTVQSYQRALDICYEKRSNK